MNVIDHWLYARWAFWRQICYNPTNSNYYYAGQRGITVDFNSFEHMVEYVETRLGPPPFGDKSLLTRRNLKGNFAPGNLKWDTSRGLGGRNRRARKIRFQGRNQCITQWARELGIHQTTLKKRLDRGWTISAALTTPSLHD